MSLLLAFLRMRISVAAVSRRLFNVGDFWKEP